MSLPIFTLNSLPSTTGGGVSNWPHGAWLLAEVKPGQRDTGKDGMPLPREMTTLNSSHSSEVRETAELAVPLERQRREPPS